MRFAIASYDLRLHHNIQRRDRLDALALTAGEFMREAGGRALRQSDEAQHVRHQRARRRIGLGAVDQQRLHDDVFNLHARIERPIGVLEDDLHGAAPRAHGSGIERRDIGSIEPDGAVGGLDQADQRAERRLAAAGLADETQRFAWQDIAQESRL
jgi:hypothetical protein